MNIPYIFDPGQGMPMFNEDELKFFSDNSMWIVMNDYEFKMYTDITGLSVKDLVETNKTIIITNGEKGSKIFSLGQELSIPTPKVNEPKDPTGCGDAYRAGMIYGISKNMSLEKIGELSSKLGALKVKTFGTQNHQITEEIKKLL